MSTPSALPDVKAELMSAREARLKSAIISDLEDNSPRTTKSKLTTVADSVEEDYEVPAKVYVPSPLTPRAKEISVREPTLSSQLLEWCGEMVDRETKARNLKISVGKVRFGLSACQVYHEEEADVLLVVALKKLLPEIEIDTGCPVTLEYGTKKVEAVYCGALIKDVKFPFQFILFLVQSTDDQESGS
jgi:hypothetical protein